MTRKIAERSRRAPGDGKRDHKVAVRFTEDEFARIDAKAASEGLLTAAYIGIVTLAAADQEVAAGRASRAKLDALVTATEQTRRAGNLLNQTIMTMQTLRQVRPAVEHIANMVWARVEALDDMTLAVAGPLRAKKRRRR